MKAPTRGNPGGNPFWDSLFTNQPSFFIGHESDDRYLFFFPLPLQQKGTR